MKSITRRCIKQDNHIYIKRIEEGWELQILYAKERMHEQFFIER